MNKDEVILQDTLNVCSKHQSRMTYAYKKIVPNLPFTKDNVTQLSDEDVSHLDQYIFRFSKLQDAIGRKLFKAVLHWQGENTEGKSLRDIFSRLEQLGIVENYDSWNELRILRNDVSHEYGVGKQELAEKLNKLFESHSRIESYLEGIRTFVEQRR